MSNPTIDTLIFDLGGVLIDWNPRYLYQKIFDTAEEVEYFLENICVSEWNVQQDAGRSLAEATELLIAQHPKWEAHIRDFYGRWVEMLGGIYVGTVNLLEELRHSGKYRIYALTNWSGETFPIAHERYDFFRHFEGIVVSGDEKLKKPDPKLYQVLFDRYEVEPTRALFIDDSVKNIEMGRKLGLHSVHFQSSAQMVREVKALLNGEDG